MARVRGIAYLRETLFGTGTGRHRGGPSQSRSELLKAALFLPLTPGLILAWLIGRSLYRGALAAARVWNSALVRTVVFGTGTGWRHFRPWPRTGAQLGRTTTIAPTAICTYECVTRHSLIFGLAAGMGVIAVIGVTTVVVAFLRFLLWCLRLADRRAPDGDYGPLPLSQVRWRALGAVARLMPRAAGRRWRGEAESALFEMDPGKRAGAVRSYLRSAPRVVVMTWAREVSRRTRRRAG